RGPQQALPVEHEVARLRTVDARDDVEERRLAGAVRPDEPDDLAGLRLDGYVVERHDPAEPPRDVLDRQESHRLTLKLFRGRRYSGMDAPPFPRRGAVRACGLRGWSRRREGHRRSRAGDR